MFGVISAFCMLYPDARIGIVFVPGISFDAKTALMGLIALDTAGLILGWKVLDHAAHIGGALFGL